MLLTPSLGCSQAMFFSVFLKYLCGAVPAADEDFDAFEVLQAAVIASSWFTAQEWMSRLLCWSDPTTNNHKTKKTRDTKSKIRNTTTTIIFVCWPEPITNNSQRKKSKENQQHNHKILLLCWSLDHYKTRTTNTNKLTRQALILLLYRSDPNMPNPFSKSDATDSHCLLVPVLSWR